MVKGERIRDRSNIVTLTVISALRGVWNNIHGVIWQPFVLSLGVSMSSLGGFESLMDLARITFQPIVGGVSDVRGRKNFLLIRDFLALTACVLFMFSYSWHLLFLGVVLIGLSRAILPIWNAAVAESSDLSKLGFVYSIVNTSQMAAGLVATLTAGIIASLYGYPIAFAVAGGFSLASFLIILLKLVEKKPSPQSLGTGLLHVKEYLSYVLKPPSRLRGFYAAMTLDLIAFSIGYRLINGMLVKVYNYTPYMLGVLTFCMMAAMTCSQIFLGRVVDRVGYPRFLLLSQILACGFLILVLFSKSFYAVAASKILMGVAVSLWMPAEQAWIAGNVDPRERGKAIGSYQTFRGLLSLPFPIIGGFLFDMFGFDIPIIVNLVLAIVDVVLIATLIKK